MRNAIHLYENLILGHFARKNVVSPLRHRVNYLVLRIVNSNEFISIKYLIVLEVQVFNQCYINVVINVLNKTICLRLSCGKTYMERKKIYLMNNIRNKRSILLVCFWVGKIENDYIETPGYSISSLQPIYGVKQC